MKYLLINTVCGVKSTGRICGDIAEALTKRGHEVRIAYGRDDVPEKYKKYAVRIGNDIDNAIHGIQSRVFDAVGLGSIIATKRFIKWVIEYNPDVINIHNLHGYYINYEILFDYIKNCNKRVVWTLHDCWSFTGHCPYFEFAKCDKWKTGCGNCKQSHEYPKSYLDFSHSNWKRKKEAFTNISKLELVTPSKWLADLTRETFLLQYPVQVIHNSVDTAIFHPTRSSIKEDNGLQGKKIILGVASEWNYRKGLRYMEQLSTLLDDQYKVVVIGVSDEQKKVLPESMLGITHTSNAVELAKWYSAADVYVNPTLEDNYPTTNIEAIACGTPVISFDAGGSKESALLYGSTVSKGDINELLNAIHNISDFKCKLQQNSPDMIAQYVILMEKKE